MRNRLTASLLAGALALAACGGGSEVASPAASPAGGPEPAASAPSTSDTQGPSAPPVATPADADPHDALAFQAPLLDGGTFDGAVAGDVVLWFWAPW